MATKVFLVGAGPGDPGLITVRGAQILARAEAILYDGLVNPELLELAPEGCALQCVGKRGHGGSWTQSEVNNVLVAMAKRYACVVRLKGGDVSLFARTAEEVERLNAEGIPYEMVPGLTAALAVGAYAGVPLTHRDWSSAVALVTAQSQTIDGDLESEESIDWSVLARFPGTLVLYMGMSTAAKWSRGLLAAGMPASTPVLMVRRCSWPDQSILRGELRQVPELLEQHPEFQAPVVTLVGDVVRAVPWPDPQGMGTSTRPLQGFRFLLTGPRDQGLRLRERFRERGGHGILAPALAIEPVDDGAVFDELIERLAEFDWLIFSSRSGVQHFFERLHSRQRDARSLAHCRVASVGSSTAEAMRPYGIRCDWVPQKGAGAEALLAEMAPLLRGKRVLLVRAAEGSKTLRDGLQGLVERVEETIVYQQVPVETWSIDWREWDGVDDRRAVVATSSNGARQAWKLLGQRALQAHWLCLSPAVASALAELGATRLATSVEPTFASLVDRAEQLVNRDGGPNHVEVEREPG